MMRPVALPDRGWAGMKSALWLSLAALCLLLLAKPVQADPVFPKLTGRVVDGAGLLGAADKAQIEQKLAALEDKSSDQLVVVTLPGLQGYAIEDFGVRLGRHWQIGQKDKNNGVLLIVAPKERKVRIEVGYGLEGVLTDTLAGNIVHNRILPLFRSGNMSRGIVTGVNDIVETLMGDAKAVAERAKGKRRSKTDNNWFDLIVVGVWLMMFFGMMSRALFGSSSNRGGVVIVPHKESSGSWSGGGGGGG